MDFVTEDDLSETYPAAVCSENGALYSICGVGDYNSKLCISYDYGKALNIKECRQGFMEIFQEEEPAADLR